MQHVFLRANQHKRLDKQKDRKTNNWIIDTCNYFGREHFGTRVKTSG